MLLVVWPPVVRLRADAGGGRVLRGNGRVRAAFLLVVTWPTMVGQGLTQAAGASREVSGFDAER